MAANYLTVPGSNTDGTPLPHTRQIDSVTRRLATRQKHVRAARVARFEAASPLATAHACSDATQHNPAPFPEPQMPAIAFWTIRDVELAVKLKKSAIYARIARAEFPPPVKLSSTVSVWIEWEVRAWMRDAAARRS